MKYRVVLTGIGLRTPLGHSPEAVFDNLIAGQTGIKLHPSQDLGGYEVGSVAFDANELFTKMQQKFIDRVSQLAVASALDAVANANANANAKPALELGDRAGVYVGTSLGGLTTVEDHYKRFFTDRRAQLMIPGAMVNGPSAHVAIQLGIQGESQTYASACASSTLAIGEAYRRIQDGYVDVAIAGGAESCLLPGIAAAWDAMGVMCPPGVFPPGQGCRPFSKDRRGFSLSEGACMLVLERLDQALARGAVPVCELVGYGLSCDAHHLINADPKGQIKAMERALMSAGIKPDAIGYVNAHGTATPGSDAVEAQSLRSVFGQLASLPAVSGTKSAHGHMLGGTGALEFAITAMALQHQMLPPTTHWTEGEDDWPFDVVPHKGRPADGLTYAMSNSFGFGGNNAVLVAKRWGGEQVGNAPC